jgi:hypothetical protein
MPLLLSGIGDGRKMRVTENRRELGSNAPAAIGRDLLITAAVSLARYSLENGIAEAECCTTDQQANN